MIGSDGESEQMADRGDVGEGRRRSPSRPRRVPSRIAAAALMLIAVIVLAVALNRTTLSYATPMGPNRVPNSNTVVWTPGVLAALASSIAVLASMALAVRSWTARTVGPYWWWVTAGLLLVAGVWITITTTLTTPSY